MVIARITPTAAAAALTVMLWSAVASGQRTPLYKLDLDRGTRRDYTVSGRGSGSAADQALDALLEENTEAEFSGKDLEKLASAIKRYLNQARPRAMPNMLLFLYPGRISRSKLKELREVTVDIELQVAPCGRTVCADSLARQLEVLGKAMRTTALGGASYRVTFRQIRIRRRLDMSGADFETLRFPAEQVVAAGKRAGGGRALMREVKRARDGYAGQVSKALQGALRRRRVRLTGAPSVERDNRMVRVELTLRSDRVRYRQHVLAALAAAGRAMRKNALTPANGAVKVTALVPMRGTRKRVFTCDYQPLTLHLAGRLASGELWENYVVESS